jgi:hypothetical protein
MVFAFDAAKADPIDAAIASILQVWLTLVSQPLVLVHGWWLWWRFLLVVLFVGGSL